jgi:very-short-patch-repair endonuclease
MTQLFNHKYQKSYRRRLRNNATEAERLLWRHLKGRQLSGTKFRRQQGIGTFIADFYCPEYRLVIEVDGPTHWTKEEKEYDVMRESFIKQFGIRVIRFTNEEVYRNLDAVLARIAEELEDISGRPPPCSLSL